MKKITFLMAGFLVSALAWSQTVVRPVVVEHFTNSWCSVCFNNNYKLYANLRNNPDVLHISYYPSSPYAGCQINHFNTAANDARANYYGVYGATPKIVIAGDQVLGTGSFTLPTLFSGASGVASSFSLGIKTMRTAQDSVKTHVVVKRVAVGGPTTTFIYGVITEDTLNYNANNGERVHYNVFRAPIVGNSPVQITLPANVGDSLVLDYKLQGLASWTKVSANIILQGADKKIIQAGRASTMPSLPTSVRSLTEKIANKLKWNNQKSELASKGLNQSERVLIFDTNGRLIQECLIADNKAVSLAGLPRGTYISIIPEHSQKLVFQKSE